MVLLMVGVVVQIDPDVVEDHGKNPERKKLKLKEVYLTKLLSTKVRRNFPNAKPRAAQAELKPTCFMFCYDLRARCCFGERCSFFQTKFTVLDLI